MPNLNLTLSIGGAIIGFAIEVFVPVMFYNKAYHFEEQPAGELRSEEDEDEVPPDEAAQPLIP